jgi:hypothetical protein
VAQESEKSGIAGSVDLLRNGFVAGWALDQDNPEAPVEIEVRLGEELLGKVRADMFRQDLIKFGKGDGCLAFRSEIAEIPPEQYAKIVILAKSTKNGASSVLLPGLQALGGDPLSNELRKILPATAELKAQLRALARGQERLQASLGEIGQGRGGGAEPAAGSLARIEELLEAMSGANEDLREHAKATEVFLTRFDKLLSDLDKRMTRFEEPKGLALLRWTLGLSLAIMALLAFGLLAVVYHSYFVAG